MVWIANSPTKPARKRQGEKYKLASTCLPARRVTTQIMRYWEPHLTSQAQPPSLRCQHLRLLHSKETVNATSDVSGGAPGHSVLQHDMPDDEDPNCEKARKKKLAHCPAAHPSCLFLGKSRTAVTVMDCNAGNPGSVSSSGFRFRRSDPSGRSTQQWPYTYAPSNCPTLTTPCM